MASRAYLPSSLVVATVLKLHESKHEPSSCVASPFEMASLGCHLLSLVRRPPVCQYKAVYNEQFFPPLGGIPNYAIFTWRLSGNIVASQNLETRHGLRALGFGLHAQGSRLQDRESKCLELWVADMVGASARAGRCLGPSKRNAFSLQQCPLDAHN